MKTITAIPFGICLVSLLCGCSSFNRDWHRTANQPVSQNSVEGRWEGQWSSENNKHHGKLRCLMTRDENSFYKARFHATFARFLHFNYTARLQLHPHDIGWEFDGQADLGKLGDGVYYYEGRATATNLLSTYRSKHNRGRFEMKRPSR